MTTTGDETSLQGVEPTKTSPQPLDTSSQISTPSGDIRNPKQASTLAPPAAPPPPPPPEPPSPPGPPGPPGPLGPWWSLWIVQNAAILVFVALSIAAVLLAFYLLAFWPRSFDLEDNERGLPAQILNALVTAIGIALAFAWLNSANAQILGRGFRHLLSIHRAAVASFVVSAGATVAILIYVTITVAAAAEVKHGLYLLAIIELLLKLTAVSAIIVLITLRRTSSMVMPAALAAGQTPTTTLEEAEDRGRLEFGSLAFAFGLVVIAALVVPTDDLMRISSMMFGGDKKIEDYLPQRPLVRVQDDMAGQIAVAVRNVPGIQGVINSLDLTERDRVSTSIEATIKSVVYNIVGDSVKRIGAWPLFEDICLGTEDPIISTNLSNKLVGEHIAYLAGEGLIDFPYGDVNSLDITQYGSEVMNKNGGPPCVLSAASSTSSPTPSSNSISDQSRSDALGEETGVSDGHLTARSERALTTVPDQIAIPISLQPETIRVALQEGNYVLTLRAVDPVDPYLQVFDERGAFFGENDDSGPGVFDAAVSIRVQSGQVYMVEASSINSRSGGAILSVERDIRVETVSSEQLVREERPLPISEQVEIPARGAVFAIAVSSNGDYNVEVSPNFVPWDVDLVGELFERKGEDFVSIAEDDDSGEGYSPLLTATLTVGQTYYLVVRHNSPYDAQTVTAGIHVTPVVSGATLTNDVPPAESESINDTPAPPIDSAGSPPDPQPPPGPPE